MAIKCTEQHNTKCLSCGIVPYRLIRIGVFYMCPRCFNGEFGEGVESIEPTSILGEIYYKWLDKYKEEI